MAFVRASKSSLPRLARGFSLLALVLAAGLFAAPAVAGPWNKTPGHGYLKLGSATFASSFVYDNEGLGRSSAPFSLGVETLYAYGEVGVAKRLTLVAFVPYVISTNAHEAGMRFHALGFGDAMVGAQFGLWQEGPVVVALRTEAKLPLYSGGPSIEGRQTATVPGFPRSSTYFPAFGDGQVDLTVFGSVGGAIPFIDGFFTVEPGFRYRSGNITDAFVVNGSVGAFLLGRTLLLMLNGVQIITLDPAPGSDEVLGKGYSSIGPAFAFYVVPGLAIEVGADAIFRGRNTAGGYQVLWGVSYAF